MTDREDCFETRNDLDWGETQRDGKADGVFTFSRHEA